MNILITAGPTREYIDPVRYISNDSSGRMGFALASAAAETGANVLLIAGPVELETPKKVVRLNVVSAREMMSVAKKYHKWADIIICAAAVADYRPRKYSTHKIKRTIGRSGDRAIGLTENPDILAYLGKHKRKDQLLCGFALETKNLIKSATEKLLRKKCDLIIANLSSVIGSEKISFAIINRSGVVERMKNVTKKKAAQTVIKRISSPASRL